MRNRSNWFSFTIGISQVVVGSSRIELVMTKKEERRKSNWERQSMKWGRGVKKGAYKTWVKPLISLSPESPFASLYSSISCVHTHTHSHTQEDSSRAKGTTRQWFDWLDGCNRWIKNPRKVQYEGSKMKKKKRMDVDEKMLIVLLGCLSSLSLSSFTFLAVLHVGTWWRERLPG